MNGLKKDHHFSLLNDVDKVRYEQQDSLFDYFKIHVKFLNGAVLRPRTDWEMVRFKINKDTCIIYRNKKGDVNFNSKIASDYYIDYLERDMNKEKLQ